MTTVIELTNDQQKALVNFFVFMADPLDPVFVLSGYSGCGKTTLITTILEKLPEMNKANKLLNIKYKELTNVLTATTNKAAENFSSITDQECVTIHSFLGLRVLTDYKNNSTRLSSYSLDIKEDYLIFIDEASYVDKQLLEYIFKKTNNCKIVFIGDPAQLTPVKTNSAPVFLANFKGAHLSQVVRQAEGNPIIDLSTSFRNTVNSGQFFNFSPDGNSIVHLNRDDFNAEILAEFGKPNHHFKNAVVLAWTNKRVIQYNNYIKDHVSGNSELQKGDYAICNKYISKGKMHSVKTDEMVFINSISLDYKEHNVIGKDYEIDGHWYFMPNNLEDKKDVLRKAKTNENFHLIQEIDENWIDLRSAYACTINKSQGSTFDKVFIDLDDIKKCNSGNQIARMMYVACSRARTKLFLTGDLF